MSPQLCDFHLPLTPEELLKSGGVNQYVVQEVLSIRNLPSQLKAFQTAFRAQGPLAMLEHFDTVYSILHHFRSIDPGLKEDALEFLIKVVSRHAQELPAILDDATLSVSDRSAHLNALKMNCYALVRLLESFETMTTRTNLVDLDLGKGKKARAKSAHGFDWEEERQPILQLLTQLLQLDIRHLWNHSIIEEEFVSLVTGCCYRLLENPTIGHQKNRSTREAITRLLGVALTHYNHMLSATVKIIQMLQHFEHLPPVLVAAVSLWATDYGMKSIVGEIVREIGQKCPQELSRDPIGAKGFAAFLTELAEHIPAILMSSMCILLDHLDGENYMMRNAVLAAMAEMILQVLNGDQLEEAARDTRDQFLDTLQAHGHDVNSFVRSRVLQLFTRIVQQKALPLTRFQAVVALAVGRLADKSVLVCKNAIQLLASFLTNNPFSCKLSDSDLAGPLQKETQKLQELRAQRQTAVASAVLDPEEEWEAMLPELKSTLQQLLTLPQEEEEIPEKITTETTEEVKGRIHQLLAKASYKQAIIVTREAMGHFQESEPFSHMDPKESEEIRLLNLLGTIFKGASASTQEKSPPASAENVSSGQTDSKDNPSVSEPEKSKGKDELVKQEMLVQYLQDAYNFSLKITEAIGIISKMMYENTTTVVQEVIEFFVMAFQFGVPQALFGVRRMLPLIWSKEPGIREAVLNAYRQLYLNPKGDSARAKAHVLIQNLSLLLVDASVGTIQCLEEILCEFVQKDELKPSVTQLLWEQATEKVPCSPLERCSSVMLLGMMARGKPEIVGSNLDTLVSLGLEEKFPQDYRLAQQVCLAIANISDRRKPSLGKRHPPFRLPQEHRLFERLQELVTKGFVHPDPLWIPFKEVAVTLIYQLAEGPEVLCAQILQRCAKQALEKLVEKSTPQDDPKETPMLPTFLLMNLLSLAGDVALQQLVHLEQAVSGELCRRRVLREERENKTKEPKEKNTSTETTMEEEMGLVGATADDTEAELIRSICEMELLGGEQMLAAFVPLLLKVCNNPGLYSNPELCAAASLALGKFCMISATFCDSQLRLLFTMLEKSSLPILRSNIMIATGDLAIRFPNLVDPWTPHLYARLRDPAQQVRKTAGLVMTHLILKDMVKVKGQVSEMAVLLIDPVPQIAALAKNFFNELSHKGNAIYNLLPDIISRLSDPEGGVKEEAFHTIMKQLLSYITKDKQTESLVEKLCQRFRTARTDRQYRDLAYCVSQLPLTERGLRKMLDNFECFGDKLSDESVFSAFLSVVGKLRRGAKPEGKAVIDEFEQKLRACHTRGLDAIEELEIGQGDSLKTPAAKKQSVSRHQHLASAASDNDFVTPEPRRTARRQPNTQQRTRKKKPQIVFSSDESSEEELSAEMTEDETPKKTTPIRRASTRKHRC
ncbi:condensin complex subunit 1 isoform X1 [Pipistrellus kuhlii]|uniref:Condensin complex subunit 1 n=2 Tax=Pipistrellus kuhlii TaxID=59472 RepID=A0A7J7ZLB3_PIPKU|nr:condensin complex subunit 1 isoform X1 [Pipistrellus kuhlii]XP_036311351.1 condensin complex subunit 1 isoform X1 [Pipistrellus kuhlii]XP_036311353.1 condensin complex subunit 1 isoform X1 [Pipistrellus kuhlii]XP_045443628.1 condensin complex subunit 1 isoform X1 [Pipistrellus kuhlii]KAF6374706.1 non-SMC condensin I complex subunit D2 [Pipistrellus kuhlii]